VRYGWDHAYSPEAIAKAVESLDHKPLGYRINILIARLCFRGIYFPQMGLLAWTRVLAQSRGIIYKLVKEGFRTWRGAHLEDGSTSHLPAEVEVPVPVAEE
jgi:hypothetical protein